MPSRRVLPASRDASAISSALFASIKARGLDKHGGAGCNGAGPPGRKGQAGGAHRIGHILKRCIDDPSDHIAGPGGIADFGGGTGAADTGRRGPGLPAKRRHGRLQARRLEGNAEIHAFGILPGGREDLGRQGDARVHGALGRGGGIERIGNQVSDRHVPVQKPVHERRIGAVF